MALDGMKIIKIAAGGWHSAAISGEYKVKHEVDIQNRILILTFKTTVFTESHDLYMFGWNESGQLAQPTNLARPAECFSAVEVRKNTDITF